MSRLTRLLPLRRRGPAVVASAAAAVLASTVLLGPGLAATFTDAASSNGPRDVRDIGDGTAVTSPTLNGTNAPASGMSAFAATRTGVNCDLTWSKVTGATPDRIEVTSGARVVTSARPSVDGAHTDAKPGLKAQPYSAATRKGENWTSPANLARTTTCAPARITPANAAWESLSGEWTQSGTRQVTTTAGAANPLRVVDAGDPDADVSIKTSPVGGGDAVVLRASDKDNYLRARTAHSVYTYAGTHHTGSRFTGYSCSQGSLSGSSCVGTQTRYCSEPTYSQHADGSWRQSGTRTWACGTDSVNYGSANANYESYSYYTCDQGGSGSSTCTRQDYAVTLEKVVKGAASTLWSWTSGTSQQQVSALRVTGTGQAVKVYLNDSASPAGQVSETFNQSAPKHGVSYAVSPVGGSLLDSFLMVAA